MAPSSTPSIYLSVIKIRNILWWLLGDFSDRRSPSHTGDEHNKWQLMTQKGLFLSGPKVVTEWTEAGLEGALFIHSQMLCILCDWAQYFW